jgi:hypothetical protein
MRRPFRFEESVIEEALAVATFLGRTAFAMAVMAGSVAAAGVRVVLLSRKTRSERSD